MKSENFVIVQGWMCNELELKGNDLLVFALIYGFSQDGESAFHGSRNYIANTFNISKPTVDKAIQNLLDKHYIIKYESEDFNTPNSYSVNIQVVKELYMSSKETLLGSKVSLQGGSKETLLGSKVSLQGGSKETLLNNTSKQTNSKNKKDINIEFEFGGKQKPKKDNLFTKCVSLIDSYDFSCWGNIRNLLIDYLQFRMSIKEKPLYTNMWKGMLNKLVELCNDDISMYESVIKQSIERGYLSFYPISSSGLGLHTESGARHVPRMTQEDYDKEAEHLAELEAQGMQVRF
jgi:hypothetical protein